MPIATAAIAVSPLDSVKMDERKRPAADDISHSTPPLKRQAVSVNGSSSHADSDLPWNDEIDRYQKDAILRQMREYKREKNALELQLAQITKRSLYHDDHLRTLDAWFLQLLDDVALLSSSTSGRSLDHIPRFSSSLLSATNDQFEVHLRKRSEDIKSAISHIFAKVPLVSPDVRELQERLSNLLAAEKSHTAELQRAMIEKDQMSERLETAVSRYMLAEKKLDRAKSAQVAKLEAQAIASSRPEPSGAQGDQNDVDGTGEAGYGGVATEGARREAVAVAEKRTEQLELLRRENEKLTNDLTAVQIKLTALTDEDYASSDLFKTLKAQHEDVIKRVNDLEATNIQLREEAKILHGERTAYREEADNELRSATIDMQSQLAQTEADLSRVRHARDELMAEIGIRKATVDQHKASLEQMKELHEAREIRISVLEAEVERIRLHETPPSSSLATESHALAALEQRIHQADSEKASLENELRSMEAAWRKTSALASKKLGDTVDAEDKISKYSAEKAKADQKYFASMKSNEAKQLELKALRAQDSKSSEIVSQLKEAESSCRGLLVNLEKQLAEAKDTITTLTNQHRTVQQIISEHKISIERLNNQTTELKKSLVGKDAALQTATQNQRQAEVEVAELKVRLDQTEKSLASWKKKGIGNQSEEYEMLRTLAQCNVCHSNWKNTAIKTCGHVCCQECIDKQIQLRSRKCPLCGKVFGNSDHMRITL